MRSARRVCRPSSFCAIRISNRGESRCAEQGVLEARPLGTCDCGHLGEGGVQPLRDRKRGCGWLMGKGACESRVGPGLKFMSIGLLSGLE